MTDLETTTDTATQQSDLLVICQLGHLTLGIPSDDVIELLVLPSTRSVPGVPDHIRGVMESRGRIVRVIDLRILLGLESYSAGVNSFCEMLQQRALDHKNWLAELEASVAENRPFTLTTDPHRCAFGRWYDSYHTEDSWLALSLRKLDLPHRRIHNLGLEVTQLVEGGKRSEAQERLATVRKTELSIMMELFDGLIRDYRESNVETAVILRGARGFRAIAVDAVQSVEKIAREQTERVPSQATIEVDFVRAIGHRSSGRGLVLILDPTRM